MRSKASMYSRALDAYKRAEAQGSVCRRLKHKWHLKPITKENIKEQQAKKLILGLIIDPWLKYHKSWGNHKKTVVWLVMPWTNLEL